MYRKITVNGVIYEYVIRKTHIKIKGFGSFPKQEIGRRIFVEEYCECCGTPISELYPSRPLRTEIAVTPADVAKKIKALAPVEQNTFDALLGK